MEPLILYRVSTASLYVRRNVHRNELEFYEFAIVVARFHSAASMVTGCGFNRCCSIRTHDSSGDEHVGFFRCIDRLQYGLQKHRSPRPTTLSGNFYGSSVSSA